MSGDGQQMIVNTPREALTDALKTAESELVPAEKKQPVGTVERVLNFRERNMLIGACRQFCDQAGKGDHKAQAKLDRLIKAISFQETVDYLNMIDDSLEDAMFKWQRIRNDYLAWKQYEGGGIDLRQLKEKAPSVDISSPPEKPPRRQPEATPLELRGKERSFYLPSKLDAWVQDVLKVATFQAIAAEYSTELCAKFGIKDEE